MKHGNLQKKFSILEEKDSYDEAILQQTIVDFSSDVSSCSVCADSILDYVPNYHCGVILTPVCDSCMTNANLGESNLTPDAFSSFTASEMPLSLVPHWIPPHSMVQPDIDSLPSLRTHYVMLPGSGDYFIAIQEVLLERHMVSRGLEDVAADVVRVDACAGQLVEGSGSDGVITSAMRSDETATDSIKEIYTNFPTFQLF